jgi:hypothetical protein
LTTAHAIGPATIPPDLQAHFPHGLGRHGAHREGITGSPDFSVTMAATRSMTLSALGVSVGSAETGDVVTGRLRHGRRLRRERDAGHGGRWRGIRRRQP